MRSLPSPMDRGHSYRSNSITKSEHNEMADTASLVASLLNFASQYGMTMSVILLLALDSNNKWACASTISSPLLGASLGMIGFGMLG